MAITLHNINSNKGRSSKKRVGRGLASKGTTAGRGQKGQKARSGASGFQRRGMRQLMLATPKLRGFKSGKPAKAHVNLKDLAGKFKAGEQVTPESLLKKGLVRESRNGVKILSVGEITDALTIKGCAVSKAAAEKILAAGGKIIA